MEFGFIALMAVQTIFHPEEQRGCFRRAWTSVLSCLCRCFSASPVDSASCFTSETNKTSFPLLPLLLLVLHHIQSREVIHFFFKKESFWKQNEWKKIHRNSTDKIATTNNYFIISLILHCHASSVCNQM